MNYYLDLFSPETYEAFSASARNLSGFRMNQETTARRVEPGDLLICYMTGLSRWIGVLEVLSEPFIDHSPLFYPDEDPFVVRFNVRTRVWLPKEKCVPIHDAKVWNALSFTRDLDFKSYGWTGTLRRSLYQLSKADGASLTGLLERVDVSILDDQFLQTFKDQPHQNLRLKLLETLLKEELLKREAKNLLKARSFKELLEETIRRYHQRLTDAATVIEVMIKIRKEMDSDDRRASELGLEEDELAFYDALAANLGSVYDQPFLRGLIHEVVQSIKRNLKVDWTEPHREDVKAAVWAAVKRVLRSKGVRLEDLDRLVPKIMEQAEALYRDWPRAA